MFPGAIAVSPEKASVVCELHAEFENAPAPDQGVRFVV